MVINFTRQLYTLMKAGVPLLKALEILNSQLPEGRFRRDAEQIISDIQQGKSFSESLSISSRFFSLFYINMIKAGEISGNLTGILKELSEHLIQQRRITRQVSAALMYPVFVLVIAFFILTVLLMFVIPVFTRVFEDLGGRLPPATAFLISLSRFTARWGWLFLIFIAILCATVSLIYRKTTRGKRIITRVIWNVPLFGHIIKTMEIGRFCRTLGSMLSSGVTLVAALDVLMETTTGILLRSALADIRLLVEQGDALSSAMESTNIFPLTLVKMIQVGEESGKIADIFLDVAEDYEDEVSFSVSGLLSLLEPALIIVMGGIVGFIVVALFFPIFSMSGLVK